MKVHLIGIGGTGMGALAGLLQAAGHEVRGSDGPIYPPMSTQLEAARIPVFEGFDASNLDWGPDCVVVGNICREDHVEVVAARARAIKLESFPSMLARSLLDSRRSLVVAGTHGKTTTTSLLAWMLQSAGRDPSYLIGGVPQNLGRGSHLGGGDLIVLEGDEYDTAFFDKQSKFLHYRPARAILTSVEFDHADIFADFAAVRAAFVRFVATIPREGLLVVDANNEGAMDVAAEAACEVVTYKVLERDEQPSAELASYCVVVHSRPGTRRTLFEVFERGESLGEFSTLLSGSFNVANITAALAVARAEGCELELLRDAVRMFRGVRRRQELLGVVAGVRLVQDFAHHPRAVDVTIRALRRRYPDHSLHVCFEPRSSSSRRDVFFAAYSQAFDAATRVYLAPVYAPERVPADRLLDVDALASAVRDRRVDAAAYASLAELTDAVLDHAAPGDTVVLLSSGSFGGIADVMLERFGDAVTFARLEDLFELDKLLRASGMAELRDVDQLESLVVRPSRERRAAAKEPLPALIGCVHLQLVGETAFLFGLAVVPACRGEGLGWVLADSIMRRARSLGARRVVLIAGRTADFFADKLGFHPIEVADIEPCVRALDNFAAANVEGSVCMINELSSAES